MSEPEEPAGSLEGQRLAGYEVLEKIGEGGMGRVYSARDVRLERKVALKVLSPEFLKDPDRRQRFEREAKVVAGLNHPNIITLFSVEEDQGLRFLTMELVLGQRLQDIIPRSGLELEVFFEIAVPLADALSAAHAQGITHRDLKPSNVMVTDSRRVKVLDFGLAKLLGSGAHRVGDSTDALTRSGFIMGTIPYMSPEQVRERPIDHRSDIFSLGIVLYEMLAGERPFRGKDLELVGAILRDPPPPLDAIRPDLPPGLADIVTKCLEKDPAQRFQKADEVWQRLREMRKDLEIETALSSGRRRRSLISEWRLLRGRGSLLDSRLGLTLVMALVFGINWLETALETSAKESLGWGGDLAHHLTQAVAALESDVSFENHAATNMLAVYGYSISYFFFLPLLGLATAAALARRADIMPFRTFSLGLTLTYLVGLPFFLFFPVLERWAYPESGAVLLSDRWSSRLIEAFRPISGLDNCFPSFHVSMTVVIVVCSFLFGLRFRWSVLALGATVILSTFVLGIHWMADIVAGLAAGIVGTALGAHISAGRPRIVSGSRASRASFDSLILTTASKK
jgi:serine/threonine protein kinase/membrane-associated phospholipid phosphatase